MPARCLLLIPLAPVIGFIAPKGLWILVMLTALWGLWHVRPSMRDLWSYNPWLWSLFLVGLALSPLSLIPGHSAVVALRLLLLTLCGSVIAMAMMRLDTHQRGTLALVTLGIATGIGALALLDMQTAGMLSIPWRKTITIKALTQGSPYSRGAAFLALLLFPCAFAGWQGGWRRSSITIAFLALAVLSQHSSETAIGAVLLGGTAAAVIRVLPALWRLVPVALATGLLLMPLLAPSQNSPAYCFFVERAPSMAHRMMIWTFTTGKIQEQPLIGYGLEAERVIEGGNDTIAMTRCHNGTTLGYLEAMPLHPHNGPLHIWFDLGLVGAILAAAALFFALRRIPPGTPRVATTGGAVIAFVIASLGYGLWQTWFVCALWIALLFLIPLPQENSMAPKDGDLDTAAAS
ncbi:O-antigen ligase family protein [Haematospirillum sp. 15-248]|uniref:O-antigen ligase family protein n=1 Tax=Haematospirillum sp. 15-248 TaxID=2723107 RepID=UPI001439C4AE|nr:O-antigen ligase family protein [Haematospirillum sp. 15-248]NKD87459.1 O-antigen ligase family protein [Haematospirillum sp. 15-248]